MSLIPSSDFAAGAALRNRWVILVGGHYGAFLFEGTEAEAEEMRTHKARWEGAIAHKRSASFSDLTTPSACWNHPGFVRLYWFGSRGRRRKKPWVPRFLCDCGACEHV